MGSLFGGYLSQYNEVWLVGVDAEKIDKINRYGITIHERQEERTFHPKALTNSTSLGKVDLIIVFVKAMHTRKALETNKHLIGENIYVMTLQNGAGHEEYTSIYTDLRDGRRTEVDTISGSVVKAAQRLGVSVPSHEFVVELVHAMEDKRLL